MKMTDKDMADIVKVQHERDLKVEADFMKSLQSKLNKVEAKNKCIRVQFLDWLSEKLKSWSLKVKEASIRIDSPCIIKFDNKPKFDNNPEKLTTEQADYFFDPSSHNFIDIKGLKAGKSYEECTYTMYKGRGLVSLAHSAMERDQKFNSYVKKVDESLTDITEEFKKLIVKGE